jgi:GNAT superfamily N-acetyltransferase
MIESHVRKLDLPDLPELMRLYAQLSPHDVSAPSEVLARTWTRITADPALVYVGVFLDETLVSTCHAALIANLTRSARPYALIEGVFTDATQRRRGFGALAMRSLLAYCWDAGCYKVMLMSGASRVGAHSFYDSLGFDRHAKQGFVISRLVEAAR